MISSVLRRARISRGLTLRQVAARSGIAESNLSRLETGGVDPRMSTVTKVLEALDMTLAVVPTERLTIDDVKERMEEGAARLRARGVEDRDVAARLAWKEAKGVDTTVERRMLGL